MQGDLYATKGMEYLIVIAYLLVLAGVVGFFALPRIARRFAGKALSESLPGLAAPWPAAVAFHQGHSWVGEPEGDLVAVGMDDFAATAIGACDAIELPPVGSAVRQGGPAWTLSGGGRRLAMVSPVWGEVAAVNPAVLETPSLAADDPYGAGWLLKVRAPDRRLWIRNLLAGDLAALWRRNTLDRLRRMEMGALGAVMADGGAPARGFARALDEESWSAVAREFFLTE